MKSELIVNKDYSVLPHGKSVKYHCLVCGDNSFTKYRFTMHMYASHGKGCMHYEI